MRLKPFSSSLLRSRILGFLPLGILFIVLPLIVFFSQQQQNTRQQAAPALPPQGLYESCAPTDGQKCLDRLDQMAKGGFKLVINYDQFSGTKSQELAYAAKSQALGMKVIWEMSDPWWWDGTDLRSHYSDLAASCNCSDNKGFITYVVNLVKGLPATWGYYVGDEEGSRHAGVKSESDLVHSIDSNHPRLYVSCANCDHDNGGTYVSSLAPMVDVADVIGPDWYPIGNGDTVVNTAEVAKETQALANSTGDKPTIVLQAFSWASQNSNNCTPWPSCAPWPSETQMRQMRDLALQNETPPLILWYSFFDIMSNSNATQHWNDLVAAAGADIVPTSGMSPPPTHPSKTPMPMPTNSPATPTPSVQPSPTSNVATLTLSPGSGSPTPTPTVATSPGTPIPSPTPTPTPLPVTLTPGTAYVNIAFSSIDANDAAKKRITHPRLVTLYFYSNESYLNDPDGTKAVNGGITDTVFFTPNISNKPNNPNSQTLYGIYTNSQFRLPQFNTGSYYVFARSEGSLREPLGQTPMKISIDPSAGVYLDFTRNNSYQFPVGKVASTNKTTITIEDYNDLLTCYNYPDDQKKVNDCKNLNLFDKYFVNSPFVDFNVDGNVDGIDYNILIRHFGETGY